MPINKEESLVLKQKMYKALEPEKHLRMDNLFDSYGEGYSPVAALEKTLDISGIQHHYKIPGGMEALEFERLLRPLRAFSLLEKGDAGMVKDMEECMAENKVEFWKRSKSLYDEFVELNPELKGCKVNGTLRDYMAVLSGACSGFPPEDVMEFIGSKGERNNYINERRLRQNEELKKLTRCEKRFDGKDLIYNWCPSDKTFDKIKERWAGRQGQRKIEDFMQYREARGHFDD